MLDQFSDWVKFGMTSIVSLVLGSVAVVIRTDRRISALEREHKDLADMKKRLEEAGQDRIDMRDRLARIEENVKNLRGGHGRIEDKIDRLLSQVRID